MMGTVGRRRWRVLIWGAAVSIGLHAPALAARAQAGAARGTHVLVVAGVGGERRFTETYRTWSLAFATAASTRFGVPDSLVTVLTENPARDPGRVHDRSTRANILRELARIGGRVRAGDRVIVLLVGHGSAGDGSSRLNVPGPDISAEDFSTAFAPMRGVDILFVNTASASGDFIRALSGPSRIVITATRSAREQNATYFPEHFLAALLSDAGDTDKDGRVNILEAFAFARREVERIFEQGNRLPTEHALLDDDGDGVGRNDASEKGPDGRRARAYFLEPLAGSALAADPRAATLLAERRKVEGALDALRGRRASMSESAYQDALEPLMLSLAEISGALRALEARTP
ncbi:MAG: C13 family peptidase [Gemmatimonadaceae bacterium]